MNAPAGGGFFSNLKLPFGMSNVSNPTLPQPNPNGNSKAQLDPKNGTLDPNNIANKGAGGNEPNNDPNNNADPTKTGQTGSQLDNFKDLFKLPTDKDGNPQLPHDPMAGPILKPNQEKLKEIAGKLNFTGTISPELMQKAASGQDPQAFMDVLNAVGQGAFLQAINASIGTVETALGSHTQRIEQALPDRIRSFQIRNTAPKHPVLSHPAVAPVLQSLKDTISAANPTLPPDRIADMAENYVIAMSKDINSSDQRQLDATKKKTDASGNADVNWFELLGGASGNG